MKLKLLGALFVIKIMFLASWLSTGYLDTPASAVAETGGVVEKPSPPSVPHNPVAPAIVTEPEGVEKGLLEAIKRRAAELDTREEGLRHTEDRLNVLSRDVEARVAELKKILAENEAMVKRLEEANTDRIRKTVKIYESMEPEEAATRLEKLSDSMAVLILSGMNPKKAGAVLGLVEVDKAVKLTQLLKLKKN